MSLINAFLVFLIAIYILQGLHKGFLVSIGNTVGMIASWLVGFLFRPALAETIAGSSFYSFLRYFTEGSARLANQVDGNLIVSELSARELDTIVSGANMPYPFNVLVRQNMTDLVFEGQDLTRVGDYFDYTVANVVVNIFAFLIIYCMARVIIALMINAVNFASPLPVLKHGDMLAGAGVGLVRGYLGMYALMMLIPVVLISAPAGIDLFTDLLDGSPIATYFYEHNFLLDFMPGIIGG
ncbi:CvpA family protein [Christensenellaceae bacterium OttesenSCG-928-K19]|nr:CvpA family protein [Christensenellaceae bacterium OttesenSCG-928-K19]